MNKRYFLLKTSDFVYKLPSITIFYGIYGWSAISIDEIDYQLIPKFDIKYYEITKSDIMGFKSFGNGRSVVSISVSDDTEDINFDDYSANSKNKIKIPVTQTRYDQILNSMKLFSKVLLEEEFDRRFRKLRYNGSFLEAQTWDTQVQEVERYQNNQSTPLLSAIAESKQILVADLVALIQSKIDQYNQSVQDLYIQLLNLKTEFNNCATIEDINVLYTKYFGQIYYISPEYKESHPEIFDENGEYKFTIPTCYNF